MLNYKRLVTLIWAKKGKTKEMERPWSSQMQLEMVVTSSNQCFWMIIKMDNNCMANIRWIHQLLAIIHLLICTIITLKLGNMTCFPRPKQLLIEMKWLYRNCLSKKKKLAWTINNGQCSSRKLRYQEGRIGRWSWKRAAWGTSRINMILFLNR
mgnify:CR=1 FL=1